MIWEANHNIEKGKEKEPKKKVHNKKIYIFMISFMNSETIAFIRKHQHVLKIDRLFILRIIDIIKINE